MLNNTLTLSENSNFFENTVRNFNTNILFINNFDTLPVFNSSIELKRLKIKENLMPYFKFINLTEELVFLENNIEIVNILPEIAKNIKNEFDRNALLTLELLNENNDWKTIFINVYTSASWEESSKFVDLFLDNMYTLFPNIAPKLNLNILPK